MRDLYVTPVRRLFAFALLILLVSQAVISYLAWSAIEEKIRPELHLKAMTVATSVNNKIMRALDYGIPFNRLTGVSEFFAQILKENEDIAYLAVLDRDGRLMHSNGANPQQIAAALPAPQSYAGQPSLTPLSVTLPADAGVLGARSYFNTPQLIRHQGDVVGVLHVGVDQNFIAAKVSSLRYDVGIILLTSILIAFEILLFIISLNYLEPMRQIAELMMRMAAGDFSRQIVVHVSESIGSLAARLNRIGTLVNQRFSLALQHAADSSMRSPADGVASGSAITLLRSRYVFAESGASHGLVQQRVVSIRILTFLFMFAEMLSRSFLPIYIGTLPEPGLGLAPSLTASIPLTANLLGVACSLPFAGRLSDSIGRRNSYTLGAMILALGLVGAGISGNFYTLLLARTVSGVGYALLFMACQGYVIDNTNENNRSRGIAAFVSAIMVAEICAPAVGGILADRIGYQLVFIFAAFVAVLATMLAIRTLDNQTARARSGSGAQSSALPLLIKNHRFIAISVLAGIPAKLLLGAFLIYLVPVILTELHSSKSEIGRYTVIYGILTLALAPVFARITDRYRAHALMVGAGGLLTGAGLVPILFQASTFNVLVGIAALGLGQAMSISAQLGLVTTVTLKEAQQAGTTAVLGMFRLIERLGGAAGPAIAGALVALLGPVHAMAALGGFGMLTSLAFLIIFFGGKVDLDRAIASSAIPPEDFI